MTLNEFKSWLEGFSESIDEAPTKEQWDKIKSKLNQVKSDVIKEFINSNQSIAPIKPYWLDTRIMG
jgi:hypothetical protein